VNVWRKNRIRNEYYRGSVRVAPASEKKAEIDMDIIQNKKRHENSYGEQRG